MRIRRKKNIQSRLCNVKEILLFADLDIPNVNQAILDKKYLNFAELFGNDKPVIMEIGCGKGGFVLENAILHPEYNFLAIELLSNVIVSGAEMCLKQGLNNVRFFNCGAEYLPRYIKENSIKRIYLNFSPPFGGKRYENRRLTYDTLVNNYRLFLTDDGDIFQKTDDKDFFNYSFSQFEKFGFEVLDITSEIKNGNIENICTEYEKKFLSKNIPLYYLIAKK